MVRRLPDDSDQHVDSDARATNLAVARLFEQIAQSLEVAGEQGHRLRAYRRAARSVAAQPEPLRQVAAEGRLREIPAIGPAMAALITEFLETGAMRTHRRLTGEHPPGLAPVLQARGFGPAAVQALFAATGATDLDEIERLGREGRLAEAIGARRAEELLAQLPALRNPIRTLPLKSAWETARLILEFLAEARPRRIEVAGAARRMCEMVVGGLDIVATPGEVDMFDLLVRLPPVVRVSSRSLTDASVRLFDGLEVRLHLTSEARWGW